MSWDAPSASQLATRAMEAVVASARAPTLGRGALALASGATVIAIAVVVVIGVNAIFAIAQELQAERALEALSLSPEKATVLRDRRRSQIPARDLVPGDVLLIQEGNRISPPTRVS